MALGFWQQKGGSNIYQKITYLSSKHLDQGNLSDLPWHRSVAMTYLMGWFGFDEVEVNWDNQVDAIRLGLNDECNELFKTER